VLFGLFDKHWNAGTGRPAKPVRAFTGWTPKDFADALATAGAPTDTDTINKWQRHLHVPRSTQFNAILSAFFGTDPDHADLATMRLAWTAASTRPPRTRRTIPANPADFRITGRLEVDGLVEFKAHPTPGNTNDSFRLDATLSFGILAYDHDETPVEVALTDAEIVITSTAYQFVQGSRACDRTDHAYLKPRTGCIGVEGPLRRNALFGDPIGTEHLAMMQRVTDDEGPVTVEVRARALLVRVESQAEGISVNRNAVIAAVLGEGERKDHLGRLVFARARIHRRVPS